MRHGRAVVMGMLLAGCTDSVGVARLFPEISVPSEALDFEDVAVPTSRTLELALSNAGRATLEVDLAITGDDAGAFTIDTPEASLEGRETLPIQVTFAPPDFLPYTAELVLTSNDEDDPEIVVPLSGKGVSAPMPDILLSGLSIDFGETDGQVTEILTVENVGAADLVLGQLVQTGSPDFALLSDPSGNTLAPGDDVPIVLSYTPEGEGGDDGLITIPSNDPDEGSVDVVLLGNGGAEYDYPIAKVSCPSKLDPPQRIQLDGRASEDPEGGDLTFAWTLLSVPTDSTGAATSDGSLESATEPVATLFVDAIGTYEVQLVVTNDLGIRSAPARCTIEAEPDEALVVELTWNTSNADVDLHLARGDAEMFDAPDDVTWCNRRPDWPPDAGTDDDPRLDLDDRAGRGPETIAIPTPGEDAYTVRVHYFKAQGDGTVVATVRVFLDGVLSRQLSRSLEHDEQWDVARIDWEARTVGELGTVAKADKRLCE